ncbi:HAD family hydrolase [Helicobacter sp. 23-1045]
MIILFDMDGTLIDSTEAIYESFCAVFEKHKMPILSRTEVESKIGYQLSEMFAFFGAESRQILRCCEDYKAHYAKIHNAKTKMIDGAVSAIETASAVANLGIVTTKSSDSTKNLLAHFGVAGHFSAIVGRDDVTHPKPHKEPIETALSRLKSLGISAESSETFMIGDTILDLQSAKCAGIVGVGVLCGYGKKAELEQYSEFIFESTKEAVEWICKMR